MINIKPGTIITLPKNRLIFHSTEYDLGNGNFVLEKSKKVIFLAEELKYFSYSVIKILIDGKVKYTYYSSR